MLRIIKGWCVTAGLPDPICNHTFRGTGITVFLKNGGSLEAAQDRANQTDPRTTKLYDRRKNLATRATNCVLRCQAGGLGFEVMVKIGMRFFGDLRSRTLRMMTNPRELGHEEEFGWYPAFRE